jgi:hypothetical protein
MTFLFCLSANKTSYFLKFQPNKVLANYLWGVVLHENRHFNS